MSCITKSQRRVVNNEACYTKNCNHSISKSNKGMIISLLFTLLSNILLQRELTRLVIT